MGKKYRITKVRKHEHIVYHIQVKRWWLPFWYSIPFQEYIHLINTKDGIEYLKSPTVKTILPEDFNNE